jgi:hypothetical protein
MSEEAVETAQEGNGTLFDGVETPEAQVNEPNPQGNDPNTLVKTDPATRPEGLPEKFSSVEELAQAYNEMGKKIRDKFNLPEGYDSPDQLLSEFTQLKEKNKPPESYELTLPEGVEELSEDDVQLFKEVSLNNEQAQKVVDYVIEAVVPAIQEAKVEVEKERLARTWNMDPKTPYFSERMSSIKQWADQNLPKAVVQELSQSSNGVNAIYKMMQAGFEKSQVSGQTSEPKLNMIDIQSMVNDDRYWTDAAFRQEVERKVQNLHRI